VITRRRELLALGIVHAVSYPILVWLVWTWLGIAESSTTQLALSIVLGLFIVAASAWLIATAFDGSLRVRSTWLRSLVFVGMALLLLAFIAWAAAYRLQVLDWFAAKLSGLRGRAVNPRSLDAIYLGGLWLKLALILAVLVPPLLARTWRVLRDWRYWAAVAVLALAGAYVPWRLVTWVPDVKSLASQATSMGVRFTLAYLLIVAAVLAFAYVVRRLASMHQAAVQNEPNPAV
jgi:hypothetical protein